MTDIGREPYAPFELPAESSTQSLWKHTIEQGQLEQGKGVEGATLFPPLQSSLTVDVAIVGAGITGLTTGLLLQQAGYSVAIVDAHPIGYGVTGFNSGHLTSVLLDTHYSNLISNFGSDAITQISAALQESILRIEQLILDHRIDCEFKRISGYLYAERAEQVADFQREIDLMNQGGVHFSRTSHVPLPFSIEEAIRVPDQARIHPLKYVQGLSCAFVAQGGKIFENSRIQEVSSGGSVSTHCLKSEAGELFANDVVIATHTPIGFRPSLQTRLEALRSYIIGIRTTDPIEDALFWDRDEPYHYIREAMDEKGRLLIIGGEDHRTGEKRDTESCFQQLEEYARRRFHVQSIDYHWSAQLYNPADGLPYIGKIAGTYVATGYSGEGLTFGTLAAQIITDQIQGISNTCGDILNPMRAKPIASASQFLADNINTISHFVKDRLNKPEVESDQDIAPGEGRLCEVNGQKVAVYHSPDGVKHFLSPVCTHLRCIVSWNDAEKSWDCPCHGGRYDATGKVLNGPPVEDLPHLEEL